jgi:acetate kinase
MGTRCGDLDPAVLFHLARVGQMSLDEIDRLLNKRSGLLGLTGDNDLREVGKRVAAGDEDARIAVEVYAYRIRKYIGAYALALGRLDAVAFTAGVGENDAGMRARVLEGLEGLGLVLDPARNAQRSLEPRVISADDSKVSVLVVPTNEELEIARQAVSVVTA